jgi:hypothetical protein
LPTHTRRRGGSFFSLAAVASRGKDSSAGRAIVIPAALRNERRPMLRTDMGLGQQAGDQRGLVIARRLNVSFYLLGAAEATEPRPNRLKTAGYASCRSIFLDGLYCHNPLEGNDLRQGSAYASLCILCTVCRQTFGKPSPRQARSKQPRIKHRSKQKVLAVFSGRLKSPRHSPARRCGRRSTER